MSEQAHEQLQASLQGLSLREYRQQELRKLIIEKKCACYDYLRLLERMSRSELDASGHRTRTNAEACAHEIKHVAQEIEKMIQKFERENPDD